MAWSSRAANPEVDEEDDTTRIIQAPKHSNVQRTTVAPISSSNVRSVALESFAFERARLAKRDEGAKPTVPKAKRAKPTLDVTSTGTPWARQTYDEDEEDDQPVVVGSKSGPPPPLKAISASTAAAAPARPTSILDADSVVAFLGDKREDYQGRSFIDPRRAPVSLYHSFHLQGGAEDGEGAEEEEEAAVRVEAAAPGLAEMLGGRSVVNKFRPVEPETLGRNAKPSSSVPTVWSRSFQGQHTMGVARVRLWGNLMLSAGLDGTVVLWDACALEDPSSAAAQGMANPQTLAIQSYVGHKGQAARDVWFRSDGAAFASCGYDSSAVVWDTESGSILSRFKSTHGPINAVRMKPGDENCVVAACGDRFVRHWDIRVGGDKPAQSYEHHQSAVNSVTFCDDGRRFATSSDDRQVLVWDWGVPTPAKTFADAEMPSMPALATSPSTYALLGVGLDDSINMFHLSASSGRIKRGSTTKCKGFGVRGYACEPAFSPCGKFIACGDGSGDVWVIKTPSANAKETTAVAASRLKSRTTEKLSPVVAVAWHPSYDGVLLSAGWDGKINEWRAQV